MNGKTCFFIGNRHTPDDVKKQLTKSIKQHIIEYGVTTFIVGHYGSFDSLVKEVLIETKKCYAGIGLYLLEPYALSHQIETPKNFDGTIYPEGLENVPIRHAIVQANRYMVQHSDYLIAYCSGVGNSHKLVKYAQGREKRKLIQVTLLN